MQSEIVILKCFIVGRCNTWRLDWGSIDTTVVVCDVGSFYMLVIRKSFISASG